MDGHAPAARWRDLHGRRLRHVDARAATTRSRAQLGSGYRLCVTAPGDTDPDSRAWAVRALSHPTNVTLVTGCPTSRHESGLQRLGSHEPDVRTRPGRTSPSSRSQSLTSGAVKSPRCRRRYIVKPPANSNKLRRTMSRKRGRTPTADRTSCLRRSTHARAAAGSSICSSTDRARSIRAISAPQAGAAHVRRHGAVHDVRCRCRTACRIRGRRDRMTLLTTCVLPPPDSANDPPPTSCIVEGHQTVVGDGIQRKLDASSSSSTRRTTAGEAWGRARPGERRADQASSLSEGLASTRCMRFCASCSAASASGIRPSILASRPSAKRACASS